MVWWCEEIPFRDLLLVAIMTLFRTTLMKAHHMNHVLNIDTFPFSFICAVYTCVCTMLSQQYCFCVYLFMLCITVIIYYVMCIATHEEQFVDKQGTEYIYTYQKR